MSVSALSWEHPAEIPPVLAAAGALVAFMAEDMKCLAVSEPLAAMFGKSVDNVVGRTPHEIVSQEMADERTKMLGQVLATGRPLQFIEAGGGTRFRTTFAPATIDNGRTRGVLIVLTPLYLLSPDATSKLAFAQHNAGDPLEGLTRAETELLTLIGRGMSSQQIANKLHRSIKTIESHRASLGRKLNVSNRVELALIAVRAGLVSLLPGDHSAADNPRPTARAAKSTA